MLPRAVFLLALFVGCAPERPTLWSPAYVQDVDTTSALICEISRDPTTRALECGPDAGPLLRRATETVAVHVHRLRVTGLEPDTRYRYRVVDQWGGVAHEGTFRTAPLAGRRAVQFLAVSDTGDEVSRYPDMQPLDETVEVLTGQEVHGGRSASRELLESGRDHTKPHEPQAMTAATMFATTPQAELVLHAGDVVGPRSTRGTYRHAFFDPFSPLIVGVPVFAALGNHDLRTAGGSAWDDVFATPGGRRAYGFDWGDLHMAVVDLSASLAPGSPQHAFLEADLAAATPPWKAVMCHVPPYNEGEQGGSPDLVRDLVPVLERHGVQLMLSGHAHAYQRFLPINGVTYVVLGTGGQWKPRHIVSTPRLARCASGYSFVRGVVDARTLRLEALDAITGSPFDVVTLTRP